MYKELRCSVPIYKTQLIIVNTDKASKLKKYELDDYYEGMNIYASTHNQSLKNGNRYGCRIVIVFNTKLLPKNIITGVVAHESLHASNFIFDRKGIEVDRENDEPQAYLIQWIANKCYKLLKDYL